MTGKDLVQLRRGNVLQLLNGKIVRIHNLIDDKIETLDNVGVGVATPSTLAYKPIVLTQQRLLELGFSKNGNSLIYSLVFDKENNSKIQIDYVTLETSIVSNGNSIKVESAIYIHKIQNLFWALTGEELQIVIVK